MKSAGHDGRNSRAADAAASLDRIGAAVHEARTGPAAGAPPASSAQFLVALALLRELRGQIAAWEPDLIDAARNHGASWRRNRLPRSASPAGRLPNAVTCACAQAPRARRIPETSGWRPSATSVPPIAR